VDRGYGGEDTFIGGAGNDEMYGGSGDDYLNVGLALSRFGAAPLNTHIQGDDG
jgi:Ca2+-binding RTX toxin-like protein